MIACCGVCVCVYVCVFFDVGVNLSDCMLWCVFVDVGCDF